MTDKDRDRIRAKQDRLLELAENRYPDHFQISAMDAGSPTISQLRTGLHPSWESTIDNAIRELG